MSLLIFLACCRTRVGIYVYFQQIDFNGPIVLWEETFLLFLNPLVKQVFRVRDEFMDPVRR
jgi:hypothetical protein